MNIAEFKAWLEGFTEAFPDGKAPTADQWAKIKAKIDKMAVVNVLPAVPAAPLKPRRPWYDEPLVARYCSPANVT